MCLLSRLGQLNVWAVMQIDQQSVELVCLLSAQMDQNKQMGLLSARLPRFVFCSCLNYHNFLAYKIGRLAKYLSEKRRLIKEVNSCGKDSPQTDIEKSNGESVVDISWFSIGYGSCVKKISTN